MTDPRPVLGAVSYDTDISACTRQKVVGLSYDDGPGPYTGQLLDILKQYGFRATFFICANNVGKGEIDITGSYPAIVKRMIAEGHQVASHTFSHYDLEDLSSDQRKQQMVKNERAIANIIGKYPTYMRPPYSKCNADSGCQADMKALGYHRIYFDVDSTDFENPLPSQIGVPKAILHAALTSPNVKNILSIQHDVVEQSVTNLSPYYFAQIKAKGWTGVTVGECLGDPKANWYRTPKNA